jgi:hypothetical protein
MTRIPYCSPLIITIIIIRRLDIQFIVHNFRDPFSIPAKHKPIHAYFLISAGSRTDPLNELRNLLFNTKRAQGGDEPAVALCTLPDISNMRLFRHIEPGLLKYPPYSSCARWSRGSTTSRRIWLIGLDIAPSNCSSRARRLLCNIICDCLISVVGRCGGWGSDAEGVKAVIRIVEIEMRVGVFRVCAPAFRDDLGDFGFAFFHG